MSSAAEGREGKEAELGPQTHQALADPAGATGGGGGEAGRGQSHGCRLPC